MPEQKKDYPRELRNILDALSESIASASDEDIMSEALEEGISTNIEAEEVRIVLRNSLRAIQKERLLAARRQYEERLTSMSDATLFLPDAPQKRRELLEAILLRVPQLEAGLVTAQARDINGLSDGDIESCLRQLYDLGMAEELDEHEG